MRISIKTKRQKKKFLFEKQNWEPQFCTEQQSSEFNMNKQTNKTHVERGEKRETHRVDSIVRLAVSSISNRIYYENDRKQNENNREMFGEQNISIGTFWK